MRLGLSLLFFLIINSAFGQVKEFDKLEMLYSQKHYKMVYRRSNRMLDNPEYDYSWIPSLYKSMATLQLADNEYWIAQRPKALEDAKELFLSIKKASDGKKVMDAHMHEISALKRDLIIRLNDYQRQNKKEHFDQLQTLLVELFDEVPLIEDEKSEELITESLDLSKERDKIVYFAQKHLGTPYVWSGNDPSGFDCSGFTSFVMREFNKDLPRRAVDQFEKSNKLKQKSVQKGDLVFFDNGSGISHVGIVVSNPGEPLTMIHASTSKGIVVTNIENSDYWKQRLKGFGTYLN